MCNKPVSRRIILSVMLSVILLNQGCFHNSTTELRTEPRLEGSVCYQFVETVLDFHDAMYSDDYARQEAVVLQYTVVSEDTISNPEELAKLVGRFRQDTREIVELTEYHAECRLEESYTNGRLRFKAVHSDKRFSRYEVVITNGMILAISPVVQEYEDSFDEGITYTPMPDK